MQKHGLKEQAWFMINGIRAYVVRLDDLLVMYYAYDEQQHKLANQATTLLLSDIVKCAKSKKPNGYIMPKHITNTAKLTFSHINFIKDKANSVEQLSSALVQRMNHVASTGIANEIRNERIRLQSMISQLQSELNRITHFLETYEKM